MSRVLEWGLRAWALVLVAASVVWVLGPYGVNRIQGAHVDWLGSWAFTGPLNGLLTGPVFGAYIDSETVMSAVREASDKITPDSGVITGSFGDINIGWSLQFTVLTGWQNVAYVALHVAPLLVMAALWWLLAGMVRASRSQSPFTARNARILGGAGVVLLVGAPLLNVATYLFRGWVIAESQLDGEVHLPSYGLSWLPWPVMATGVSLIVLSVVWRRGVRLERDVAGLV